MPKHLLNSNFRVYGFGIVVFAAGILDNSCVFALLGQFGYLEGCLTFRIGLGGVSLTINFQGDLCVFHYLVAVGLQGYGVLFGLD